MNFSASPTWAGIGFILLFLINAGLVITGLFFNYTWCTILGILLASVQLWLHGQLFSRQQVLQESLLSVGDLELVIGRSQLNTPLNILVDNGASFDAGYRYVQCCDTTLQMAGNMLYTEIGAGNCRMPYRMNLLNIASLNTATFDKGSVLAFSRGAKMSDCALNTGVLGIVPELLRGGSDLVWRMDRLEAFYRNTDGSFNETLFKKAASRPYIKMIEVRISAAHFLPDVSEISLKCFVNFLERLKVLSGGKPIGVCLAVADHELFTRLCRVMADSVVYLDFVTVDSASHNRPVTALFTAIDAVRFAIATYKLPTKIIASGDLVKERDILQAIGHGAHACYSVRPFQASLGAARGLVKTTTNNKAAAITAFHRNTLAATFRLIDACTAQQTKANKQALLNSELN
ncbi:MAG: hypothetical protein V4456_11955 [Bacteroidota bacterium]